MSFQIKGRGRSAEEGGGESQTGVHQARVPKEKAAQANGGHGYVGESSANRSQAKEAAAQIHSQGCDRVTQDPR